MRQSLGTAIATLIVIGVLAVGPARDDADVTVAVPVDRSIGTAAGGHPLTALPVAQEEPASPVRAAEPTGDQPAGPAPRPAGSPAPADGRRIPVGPGVRGVTDAVIQVGMVTTDLAANAAIGAAATGSDEQSQKGASADKINAAVVEHVNATGGIAGRKVEPVYYYVNGQNYVYPQGRQQEQQAACATWTEDNHVFAFIGMSEEVILECATHSRTPMIVYGGQAWPSRSRFESMADYWYAPNDFVADHREQAVGRFLIDQGFFDPGATVAVMIEDKPGIREGVDRGLKPALAAAGIEPAVEIVYPDFIESPWPNYVLQLQAAGVTHVVWSATTGGSVPGLFMMRAAENQRYRPQWGGGSDSWPASLLALNVPREQLANMLVMGWRPYWDVGDESPQSDSGRICAELMAKAGQSKVAGNGPCEFLFFLRSAMERADVVSSEGLAAGVARLAGSYVSVYAIEGASHFGPRDHEGVTLVRAVIYDPATNTFKYATPAEPVPL